MRLNQHPLIDTFGRFHSYLRMSLTEKCNLRCKYCMPANGVKLSERVDLLTLDERKTILSLFSSFGVNKFRFTGGEPTISNQLVELISYVRNLQPAQSSSSSSSPAPLSRRTIGITTNGVLLTPSYLRSLTDAGLDSINISLDTLDPTRFGQITRRDEKQLYSVMSAIYRALDIGLQVKINCVLMRGTNDHELGDFLQAFTRELNLSVRFIELMPFDGNEWTRDKYIPYSEALTLLRGQGFPLEKLSHSKEKVSDLSHGPLEDKHDTTKWYKVEGHVGRVGFITSMSEHFCGGCNRLRVTADGALKVCLFGDESLSLRDCLRGSAVASTIQSNDLSREDHIALLTSRIAEAVSKKDAKLGGRRSIEELAAATNRPMILIGG